MIIASDSAYPIEKAKKAFKLWQMQIFYVQKENNNH